jgi:hypothetical protein
MGITALIQSSSSLQQDGGLDIPDGEDDVSPHFHEAVDNEELISYPVWYIPRYTNDSRDVEFVTQYDVQVLRTVQAEYLIFIVKSHLSGILGIRGER